MTKMSKTEMQHLAFEEIGKQQYDEKRWEPKEGDFLIGEFVDYKENMGYDNYTFIVIDDGEQKWSLLESTVLRRLFKQCEIGDIIKLTYNGKKQAEKGNRTYKDYTLAKALTE